MLAYETIVYGATYNGEPCASDRKATAMVIRLMDTIMIIVCRRRY